MKIRLTIIWGLLLVLSQGLLAQVTPPGANTDAECGGDCYDLFSWSPVQDGSGNNIPNFSEGVASDANCNTTITASAEYTGADSNGPDLTGTSIGANFQGASTDNWLLGFGEPITGLVLNFSALRTDSEVLIRDCDGNEISATCISSCGTNLIFTTGIGWTGDVSYSLQLSGTYDCLTIDVTTTQNDAYSFSAGTCLSANPLPPCTSCGPNEDFKYINLTNKAGSGTGATADVELDGVLVGSAEVLFSDLDINEDLSGTTFGGFDNDGGTYLLKISLCEPIAIQQLEIKNLEVESQVSIGTTISGSGASAVLGGLSLSQCAGSNRMSLNDGAPNLVITDGPGCSANPNGSYTVGGMMTDCLYFKYHNPPQGCSYDYVGFRIGACVPDGTDMIPVCPLSYQEYATDIEDYVTNGPDYVGNDANAFFIMRDANGNFFDQNCQQIQNDVENANAIATTIISPCAELVSEEECFFCDPPPPCNTCPAGTEYSLINLTNGSDEDNDGLDEGDIYLNGVCIGDFDVVYSDLDVNEDVSGTQFGGFDNDGGVYLLQLDFCNGIDVHQLDIRNLEVESQVSLGTTFTGTAGPGTPVTLTGLDLDWCAGSTRMLPEDPPVNQVITDGPGCGANPNASYVFAGTTSVNRLYFQYHNPTGGCSYDYVGFKLGTCYTPPAMIAPVCPLEVVEVACNGGTPDLLIRDGAGNFYDENCNNQLIDDVLNGTPLQTVDIGCGVVGAVVEVCDGCCELMVICPPDLSPISCNDPIPAAATTEAEFEALGGDIPDNPGFCGTLVITSNDALNPSTDICNGRTLTRTYTIMDDMSSETCTQTMQISPPNGPSINSCPASQNIECFADIQAIVDAEIATLNANANGEISTDCGLGHSASAQVPNQTSNCPTTSYDVVYTVTDDCNRSTSCTQTFTIQNDGPTINSCPASQNIGCFADIQAIVDAEVAALNANANGEVSTDCGLGYSASAQVPAQTSNCPTTPYDVVYTVTDDCNRSTSCTQTFTIQNVGPTINSCPLDMTVECYDEIQPIVDAALVDLNTNANGEVSIVCDLSHTATADVAEFNKDCSGRRYAVVYTVEDGCGRSTRCIQRFTIDNAPPSIDICPADVTVECYSDIENVFSAGRTLLEAGGVTTACGQEYSVWSAFVNDIGSCHGTVYEINYFVQDQCGRRDQCTQTVSIENFGVQVTCIAPQNAEIRGPGDLVLGRDDIIVDMACDLNEGIFALTVREPIITGEPGCPGAEYEYWYVVENECGSQDSCSRTFVIRDNPLDGPQISCIFDEQTVGCMGEALVGEHCVITRSVNNVATRVWWEFTSPYNFDGPCNYEMDIIYYVEDACGRQNFCVTHLNVDGTPGTIEAPEDLTVTCDNIPLADPAEAFCDVDANVTVTEIMNSSTTADDNFIITRMYIAENACGADTAYQHIEVLCVPGCDPQYTQACDDSSIFSNPGGRIDNTLPQTLLNGSVLVYPNPTIKGGHPFMEFYSESQDNGVLQFFDSQGKIVYLANIQISEGLNRMPLPTATLKEGLHYIAITAINTQQLFSGEFILIN